MTALEELGSLVEEFNKSGKNNIELQTNILKLIRENNLRRPRLVILCGNVFVYSDSKNHRAAQKSVTTVDLYEIYHQVFLAALDLHDVDLAEACFHAVYTKFGQKSIRVRLMQGLLCESRGEFRKARNVYQSIVDEDPSNLFSFKRLAAIYKSRGDIKQAIDYLTGISDEVFLNDPEIFLELADLYIEVNDYTSALYCLEECLLKDPTNYFFFLRCGDLCYTIGEYAKARKYYSKSLDLNKECMRANYGLILAMKGCKEQKKTHKELRKELDKNILNHYLKKGGRPDISESLKKLLTRI